MIARVELEELCMCCEEEKKLTFVCSFVRSTSLFRCSPKTVVPFGVIG